MSPQPFQERWRICGMLTTLTPLHIGSGHATTTAYANLIKNDNDNTPVTVDEIPFDTDGKPYLPATALKGNLRRWLKDRLPQTQQSLLESLFGSETLDQDATSGKVHFFDAPLSKPLEENPQFPPSYWHPKRHTAVAVGVTIDRITRTALEKHLFHQEVIPPGTTFSLHINGRGLTETGIALLLASLQGFNDLQTPVTLGSGTAQHQGRCRWELQNIEKIDETTAKAWLEQDTTTTWQYAFKPVDSQPFFKRMPHLITPPTGATLRLELQLIFDGPFLVNDPSLYREGGPPEKTFHHQFKYDANGKAILPARSMRGAIRSQAERIIRTLGGNAGFLEQTITIEQIEQIADLNLANRLFGATGWKTPIEISDFTLIDNSGPPFSQEFVAVDRFTGGSGDHLKFNAKAVYKPHFKGYWMIDLERIEPWGLGLLALVIRDLYEGDITFGFGAGKGYGHCHTSIQQWSVNGIAKVAEKWSLTAEEVNLIEQGSSDTPFIRSLVNRFLEEWHTMITQDALKPHTDESRYSSS